MLNDHNDLLRLEMFFLKLLLIGILNEIITITTFGSQLIVAYEVLVHSHSIVAVESSIKSDIVDKYRQVSVVGVKKSLWNVMYELMMIDHVSISITFRLCFGHDMFDI